MISGAFFTCLTLSLGFVDPPRPVDDRPRAHSSVSRALDAQMSAHPGDPQRVWVFFTDKNVPNEAIRGNRLAERAAELPARAKRRRELRRTSPGLVDERDLAVVRAYVAAVAATGARVRHESRWLNAVSVEATPGQIGPIAALPFVKRLQPVAHAAPRRPMPETPMAGGMPRGGASWYNNSFAQLSQIDIPAAHDAGYTGAGVVVGILDTGFNRTHEALNQTTNGAHPVQVIAEYDFVNNDGNTAQDTGDADGQANHGTYILGVLGAYYPTVLVGAAFDASFLLAKTEDTSQEVPAEEDNYVAGIEWLELNGADMVTSSLGYIDWYTQADLDGQTAVTTIAVNTATDNGLVCCTAAGNEGHDATNSTSHLIAPADAYQVLTCGAVDSSGATASFSSDGPTADGRVKPEVLALGVSTATIANSSNTAIIGVSGTSLSTPLVAGGVALIIDAHPEWSVDKVRRAVLHTSTIFQGTSFYDPQIVRGYGIFDVYAAILFVHSDIDGDGFADGRDIAPFVDAVLNVNPDFDQTRNADIDASGEATVDDIPIFVNDLLGL